MQSTTLLWMILGIVIIGAIVFLALAIKVRQLNNRFQELEDKYNNLLDIPMPERLAEVKEMHLIGKSQSSLEELEILHEEVGEELAEVQSDFDELAETIQGYGNIKHSMQFLDYLDGRIADLEVKVHDLYDSLVDLQASEEQNSTRIQKSVDLLEKLQEDVMQDNDKFGLALPEVTKQLNHIRKTFEEFNTLNENGDPVEATKVMRLVEKEVQVADDLFTAIPPLNHELVDVFKEQIDDLADGYRRLQEQKFKFAPEIDIDARLKELRQQRATLIESLKRLDVDIVESGNRHLHQEIDDLYAIMQKEIDAETYVNSNKDTIAEFLEHAYKNNRQLTIELDHAAQNFVFHDNELGRTRLFQNEIETMQRENDTWTSVVEQKQAIYSEVEVFYRDTLNALEDIENQQVVMDQTVVKMGQDVKTAKQAFDYFEFKMRVYKRYVERYRLPGLPSKYLDYFYLVSDHIERLGIELAKLRVDTVLLNEYVDKIDVEVQEVEEKTNQLIDHVSLAEQYLQYANRYRATHDLAEQIDEAVGLFNSFQYTEAMNTIKLALNKIDPDAVKRIQKFYEQEHEPVK